MPAYEFECEKCRRVFTVERRMGAVVKPSCPACRSKSVRQLFSAFYAKTIKKS
jgi:putative FmdB family regulatory protein